MKLTSTILPPWLRRARSTGQLLPWLLLMLKAGKKWRKPDGQNRLPEIIQRIELRAGIKPESKAA